jgi:hypothetical protein
MGEGRAMAESTVGRGAGSTPALFPFESIAERPVALGFEAQGRGATRARCER